MDKISPPHDEPHSLNPAARKWSVRVVIVIALVLMLAVPLVGRAFGASGKADYSCCAIAPSTGTCT
ncbi:MAG: hypothetical protein EXR01_07965 [Acetobacteraceae bacterium]|nr:hypothetical protein [Acetobacteraceae bacterium]